MFLALVLFVGIPVLGTGAWTGILAASILELDFKESIGACFCGVLLADVDDAIFWTLVAAGFAGGIATGVSKKIERNNTMNKKKIILLFILTLVGILCVFQIKQIHFIMTSLTKPKKGCVTILQH